MQTTIKASVQGKQMEQIFNNCEEFSVRLYTPLNLIGKYNSNATYYYEIVIRHMENTDANELFAEELKRISTKKGFIILSVLLTSYQPCFHEDGKLMFFKTRKAAQKEIQFLIDDVKEEVKTGNMEDAYSLEDYKVIPATLYGEVITCKVDGISYSMYRTDDDFVPTTEFQ